MSKCKDDSCDGSHCRRCGSHFLDWYSEATICDQCTKEVTDENYRETPLGEQIEDQGETLDVINGEWN